VPDAVRDRPEGRVQIQELFRRQLRAFAAHVIEVRGLGTLRFRQALQAVEQLTTPMR
jgi:nicotinamide riboside kinase